MKDRSTRVLHVRVTEEEREKLEDRRKYWGLPTLAAYIRMRLGLRGKPLEEGRQ